MGNKNIYKGVKPPKDSRKKCAQKIYTCETMNPENSV